jgi:hypothetical protein
MYKSSRLQAKENKFMGFHEELKQLVEAMCEAMWKSALPESVRNFVFKKTPQCCELLHF